MRPDAVKSRRLAQSAREFFARRVAKASRRGRLAGAHCDIIAIGCAREMRDDLVTRWRRTELRIASSVLSLFEPCSLKLAFNLAKDSFETASGSDQARRHE